MFWGRTYEEMVSYVNRVDQQVHEVSERVAISEGMEVVGVECKGNPLQRVVRIFIDKPGGVSHADCELISKQVGTILDVEEIVSGSYVLEVSSPGLDRKLFGIEDFKRFKGKKVRLRLLRPRDGRKQFTGRLRGVEGCIIVMELVDNKKSDILRVEMEDVKDARLIVEL